MSSNLTCHMAMWMLVFDLVYSTDSNSQILGVVAPCFEVLIEDLTSILIYLDRERYGIQI